MPSRRVYRIEELPADFTKDAVLGLFKDIDEKQMRVESLSPAVDSNDRNRTLTATVSLPNESPEPKLLDDSYPIDTDFYGFTPLYTPEGEIVADIVALTGLAGHSHGSWALKDGKMWLRDILPHDFPECRILTYGNDGRLDARAARSILMDHSNNFAESLRNIRVQGRCTDRPIVFIGHSLGCLIIKETLINWHAFPHNKGKNEKPPPVAGLIFFGAPHHGLDLSAMESLVRGLPSEDIVRELKKGSPTLTKMNDSFKNLYGEFDILTIYELKPTPTVRIGWDGKPHRDGTPVMMVDQDSAILNWQSEKRVAASRDHQEIARVNKGQSGYYNQIRSFIVSCCEQMAENEAQAEEMRKKERAAKTKESKESRAPTTVGQNNSRFTANFTGSNNKGMQMAQNTGTIYFNAGGGSR